MAPEALPQSLVDETAAAILAMQRPDGRLPWHHEQHTDPWNHVEGAMGLMLGGQREGAERAYDWMRKTQRPDGSWPQSYAWDRSVLDPDADTNMCAYIAAGVWHHYLLTQDVGFLHEYWFVVEKAIDYVLDHQAPTGEIAWMHHADGTIRRVDGDGPVVRQRAWPGRMAMPQSLILTPHTEMSMKFMVEISRGCPCMCRFCWAGYNYLPVRAFDTARILALAEAARAHATRVGLVSIALCDHPDIERILARLLELGYGISPASLRIAWVRSFR